MYWQWRLSLSSVQEEREILFFYQLEVLFCCMLYDFIWPLFCSCNVHLNIKLTFFFLRCFHLQLLISFLISFMLCLLYLFSSKLFKVRGSIDGLFEFHNTIHDGVASCDLEIFDGTEVVLGTSSLIGLNSSEARAGESYDKQTKSTKSQHEGTKSCRVSLCQ